ncbi:MAG: hypothetical protein MAG431_00536 [Chloroflexi bacterium]|nr:hypothetical protein [Chloroflexota bacterium]
MKINLKTLFAVLALLVASLACSFFGTQDNDQDGTENGIIEFQDDFSDPSSGWDRVNEGKGITDYTDDEQYRFLIKQPWVDFWTNPGLDDLKNVIIEVRATKKGGPDDNDFGVICRYQDKGNFYFFLISSDGFYAIGKMQNGERTLIKPDQMYPSPHIKKGEETNNLQVKCDGKNLTLSVNKEEIAKTSDDTFIAGGDVGLIAGAFDESGVDILFDNFVVRKLEE